MTSKSSSNQKSSNTTQDLTVVGAEGSVTAGANSNTTAAMAEEDSIAVGSAETVVIETVSDDIFGMAAAVVGEVVDQTGDMHQTNINFLSDWADKATDFTREVFQDGQSFVSSAVDDVLIASQSPDERLTNTTIYTIAGVAIVAFFMMGKGGVFS